MNKFAQSGIMLLEALIGLLIFAIGILGLIGMQATAMKVTADSKYRAEATMYADQLINQMWADDRSNANLTANYATGGAKYADWYAAITAPSTGLPGAELAANAPTVTVDATNTVTVTIKWQAPGESAAHSYVTVASVTN
jgi:type IV pilus assembly protein PilV